MSRYTRHYGIKLFDDLHNYFPALIYEPDAFSDFGDVLFYVREQMRRNMDLFSAGQRTYVSVDRSAFPSRRIPVRNTRLNQTVVPLTGLSALTPMPPMPTINRIPINTVHYDTDLASLNSLMNLLSAAVATPLQTNTQNIRNLPASFMEPVPVRPTRDEIINGSAIEIVDSDDESCAICQDAMAPGSESRCLSACDHRFHVGCIDTWFQSSVRCPVCRHDIRQLTEETYE